jgi:hypothetical protein
MDILVLKAIRAPVSLEATRATRQKLTALAGLEDVDKIEPYILA